jgi:hypothetical protein
MNGFSFVNPYLLWALPLAAAPVVIYFLMRFRAVAVPWGADYVLQRAIERLRKKLFIDQLLLMALRTLAAAAIVLAIARPVTSRHAAGGTVQGSGVHHIVVLDDSASTLARAAGGGATTVWQRQKEILGKLVATWGRGERWSLLRAAGEPRWVKEYAEVTSPDDSARAVEALDPPGERAASGGVGRQAAGRHLGAARPPRPRQPGGHASSRAAGGLPRRASQQGRGEGPQPRAGRRGRRHRGGAARRRLPGPLHDTDPARAGGDALLHDHPRVGRLACRIGAVGF